MSLNFKLAAALSATFALTGCFGDNFDDAAKEKLYDEKERVSLDALALVADTCPEAMQSSTLAHLSIADSNQNNELKRVYEGSFSEELSSFKYYQRGRHGRYDTIGSQEQLETAIEIVNLLAAENIILTASNDTNNDMRATFYVHEDGRKELSIARPDEDWFWGGLEVDEWVEIRDMIQSGAFTEVGTYALYHDPYVYKEDNVLAMQLMEPDQESVKTRLGKDIVPFAAKCLTR